MKNIASISGCLLCSAIIIFSCTKTTNEISLAQSTVSKAALVNADAAATAEFMPGDSLVLRGDTSNGDETAMVQTAFPDHTVLGFVSFTALGDGLSGNGGIDRSLMKFKIRNISDSVRNNPPLIKKAVLYLYQYHRPADQNPYTISQTGDNSVELHRITGDWDSHTVTWNTQPSLAGTSGNSLEDVVIIPAVATPLPGGTNDDQVLDITAMVNKMISGHNNQGFLMKLNKQGERSHYTGRAYGSFTCPFVNKRPKLVLYF